MRRKFLIPALTVTSLSLQVLPLSAAEDVRSQVAAEISRLQDALKKNPISDSDLAPVAASASLNLTAASVALQSGQLYFSLENLLQAENLLHGARFAIEKAPAAKSGYASFEAEWKTISQTVDSLSKNSRTKDWSSSPSALRALSETAGARCVPLLDGGRGFALSTKPADGLFYLGQAQGEAEFARFASSLPLASHSAPFPLRSFLPELRALQRKANQAFKPPLSIQLHQRFIVLNSALKLARELDAQKSYAGSLYQYLEATRHFAMLDAPPVPANDQPSLRGAATAALKRLAASKQDDSILQIFLERAVVQLTNPGGSAPTSDEWRNAQVIIEHVIPAYLAARKPVAAPQQTNAKTVELTLVRWPYT